MRFHYKNGDLCNDLTYFTFSFTIVISNFDIFVAQIFSQKCEKNNEELLMKYYETRITCSAPFPILNPTTSDSYFYGYGGS